jgi:hypothetical protein
MQKEIEALNSAILLLADDENALFRSSPWRPDRKRDRGHYGPLGVGITLDCKLFSNGSIGLAQFRRRIRAYALRPGWILRSTLERMKERFAGYARWVDHRDIGYIQFLLSGIERR